MNKQALEDALKPVRSVEDKWPLLQHFTELRGLLRAHIGSFNHFIDFEMKRIVTNSTNHEIRSDADPNFFLRFTDLYVGEPSVDDGSFATSTVTPFECRVRDCTYSAPIYVNLRYTRQKQIVVKSNVLIGRLPIMLRSEKCALHGKSDDEVIRMKECLHDPGGYFVVKGAERVILIQESHTLNRAFLDKDSSGNISVAIVSSTTESIRRCVIYIKNLKIYVKQSSWTVDIPVVIVLRALGVHSDEEIYKMTAGCDQEAVDLLFESIDEADSLGVKSKEQAIDFIRQRMRQNYGTPKSEDVNNMLTKILLSHIQVVNGNFRKKIMYIAHIIQRILLAVKDPSQLDDKDFYGNKRLDLSGKMLAYLFEDLFKRFSSDLKRQIDMNLGAKSRAENFDAVKYIRSDTISLGFIQTLSTGNWTLKSFRMERAGVTEVLSRLSYMSMLGMLTRITSQFEKTRKVSGPRSVQSSQWGLICPADTPEGDTCGLVKNLALLAHVTSKCTHLDDLQRTCMGLSTRDIEDDVPGYLVFIDGSLVGTHPEPHELARQLRVKRREGIVDEFVSVYVNDQRGIVDILADEGRLCRPLIIVENGKSCLSSQTVSMLGRGITLQELLSSGVVEYVDANEEDNCLIALDDRFITSKTTHVEIDPAAILGIVAGLIPYPHHNQSPRNTYQCAMGKQAIGTIAYNQYERFDSVLYTMIYPQKPLVKTKTLDLVHFDHLPGGQNACISVMSYSGYDIEDAIVLNKGSLDRGFGRCFVFRKFQTSITRYSNGTSERTVPPPDSSSHDMRHRKFRSLGKDGICDPSTLVHPGDVLINKECPTGGGDIIEDPQHGITYTSSPVTYRATGAALVDKVVITSNESDGSLVKVMLRQSRRPEIGDKFSSRHGQKGVCGLIVNQEDMPFSDLGICPDLIMNPHGFPSRMTLGKTLELLSGKSGVLEGRQGYASAFGEDRGAADRVEVMCESLVRHGYAYVGKDPMTSGITGEPIQAYIFSGPVFYQRLKHMVADKLHARAKGPRTLLTRQPTEGRAKDGGLRMGEMERDVLIGYGASNLLIERLMISSDAFTAHVCDRCGLLGYEGMCQFCKSGDGMQTVCLPYACKLLIQELQSMNIATKLSLKDRL